MKMIMLSYSNDERIINVREMMMMIIMIRNDKNNSVVGDDIDVDANDDEQ